MDINVNLNNSQNDSSSLQDLGKLDC